MRLLHLALIAPEAGEGRGGAQFPGLGLLLTRGRDCTLRCACASATSGLADRDTYQRSTRPYNYLVSICTV